MIQGGEYILLKTFYNNILWNTSVFYHILCNVSLKAIYITVILPQMHGF